VPVCKVLHPFRCERGKDIRYAPVEASCPGAVFHLEGIKEKEHLLDMVGGELFILGIEGVGQEIGDTLTAQVSDHLIKVFPERHQLPEALLGNVQYDHMDLAVVLGEVAGHLGAHEGSWKVGDLQGSGYGVMVADGYIVHPQLAGGVVNETGRGVALRAIELTQRPVGRLVGVAGMNVKIGFEQFSHDTVYSKATLQQGYDYVIIS
jgi:hypothetical protein